MKKFKNIIKKAGISLLNILGISSLISCFGGRIFGGGLVCYYGMPRNINGTVTGEINGEVKGISGIQVSSGEQTFTTKEDGSYCFFPDEYEGEITITFKDIDGEENGSFNNTSLTLNLDTDSWENNDIKLTPKSE